MNKIIGIILCLLITESVLAGDIDRGELVGDLVPQPVLLSPRPEEVDLTGRDVLEFRWSPHEGAGFREYYDFKLYKGYGMVEAALIFKEKLPSDMYQYNINSDKFQDGEAYTWALRQVYSGGRTSAWSHVSFRVFKK